MNKKLEEYKKKFYRIIKTFKILGISIFLLGVLISIVQYTINKSKIMKENQKEANGESNYIIDLIDNTVIYQNNFTINLNIKDFEEGTNYKIIIKINDQIAVEQENLDSQNKFSIELIEEGSKNINILIYKNNKENYNNRWMIYFIKSYEKQFLDELTKKGIATQFRNLNTEDYEKSIPLLEALGNRYIRDDLYFYAIYDINNRKYNFSKYDQWINAATEKGLQIVGILNPAMSQLTGEDKKINTDEEIEKFVEIAEAIAKRYPQIEYFEILNEPNYATDVDYAYMNRGDIEWYSKLVTLVSKRLKSINKNIKILSAATSTAMENGDTYIASKEFISQMTQEAYLNSSGYSFHPYDIYNSKLQNDWFKYKLNVHKDLFNELGGFIKQYLTEYGISSYTNASINEDKQSQKLIQQTVLTDYYNSDIAIIYNFWNKGKDENSIEYNYGLLHNNYTPKLSYYAVKNYYQNTNGAEYIGVLPIKDGVEAHVYDKDGKPLIIAWSNNIENTYDFTINEMTTKDLYGKNLQPNENNQIQITTSPIYLYTVDSNYFYQAISNMTTQKYNEFTEKFTDPIGKVQGLASSIESLRQRMQNIASNTTLNETTAINLMEQHYNLGNTIMQAYQSGTLQIEYVTLSSMLDMLDSIGDYFEDLVTVSATTKNANLSETLNSITNAENLINDDDIEMVYPSKILEFSQDFYDIADYINNLEEENDIKTGLIVSKNLHSQLLAEWAIEFAKLYINDYISNTPVEIIYSTTDWTNKDVTATLQTSANITVTNNSNSKTYTFTQNGSFTFEYTIKGQAFKLTATVNNIDKTAPIITGIQNDKLYLGSVTPQVQDENLKQVVLYKDGNLVENYQTNSTISEDGYYKLIATDQANNQTQVEFYISRNPASITYSTTQWTNQDVTATITSDFEVEVMNNSNNVMHRFTQNGEFKFNIKIKETEIELTASVHNIDKTPPSITGVEKNGQYISRVTPMAIDENLQKVELYLNSEKVNNYVPNTEITEEGFYKIVATDKAGNETIVEFMVIENISKEYKLQDHYILNIENNTEKENFKTKLNLTIQYEILRDGNPLAETDILATGDILKTSTGEEYTLVVNGDINKDGDVNIKDVIRLRKYLLERNNLDETELMAADCNLDGKTISIKDLIRMRILLLQRKVT